MPTAASNETNVSGDVKTGSDFIGRDKVTVEAWQAEMMRIMVENRERLVRLEAALLNGNGLMGRVEKLERQAHQHPKRKGF